MVLVRPAGPNHPQLRMQQRPQNIQVHMRPMGNNTRQIRVLQHQQHPGHPRPRIIQQYHPQRPPPPPQPQQVQHQVMHQGQPGGGQTNEIMLNVEHHFTDNGKIVRKMPIKMGDQIIWVDCADEEQVINKFLKP